MPNLLNDTNILADKPRRKWAAGTPRSGAHPYHCARFPARGRTLAHQKKVKRWSVRSRTSSGSRASTGLHLTMIFPVEKGWFSYVVGWGLCLSLVQQLIYQGERFDLLPFPLLYTDWKITLDYCL